MNSDSRRPPAPGSSDPATTVGTGPPGLYGPFAVLGKLGEGGMGAVYLAEDAKLKRRVAIKTMRPELASDPANRDRFEREARAAAAVEHDNIVPILHVGEAIDGTPFIVMPYLKGEPLDARLKRERVAPLWLILKVVREVAGGLTAAHAVGLIHRDIKPANVWLDGDPTSPTPALQVKRCKVLDFGLARSVDGGDAQLTASGAILGTPAYMAPEQARGERVDHRADLFSLGATLYRMATGQLPFEGPTPMAVLIALTTDTPRAARELAPQLPPELLGLIERLMSKDRERRPRSAAEVVAAVTGLAEGVRNETPTVLSPPLPSDPVSTSTPQLLTAGAASEPGAPANPVRTARKRIRFAWLTAAAVCLFVSAVGVWFAFGKKPRPDDPPYHPHEIITYRPKGADTPPKKEEPTADPDRAAAKYVLSLRGCVGLNGVHERPINAVADLPTGPFRLTSVTLLENSPVTDAGMSAFAGCRHLSLVGFNNSRVGDAGLAHLKDCRDLQYLYLKGTDVGSAGLAHLKDCTELLELDISYTKVDDAGLESVKRFGKLYLLHLEKTAVTATGVTDLAKTLPGCDINWDGGIKRPAADADWTAALWVLSVGGKVKVDARDEAVADVAKLPPRPFRLTDVNLTGSAKVAAADVERLKTCKNLLDINLTGVPLNDASIDAIKFHEFPKLRYLVVTDTNVTDKRLKELAKALPSSYVYRGNLIIVPNEK